jgi:CRISPR-associated endonuclease Csn1
MRKGKKTRTIEVVPTYMLDKIKKDENELLKYCENVLELVEPRIVVKKIPMKSLVSRGDFRMYMSGKANGGDKIVMWNAVNLCLNQANSDYVRLIEKYKNSGEIDDNITSEKNIEMYDILTEKHDRAIFSKKPNAIGEKLVEGKERFELLDIKEQLYTLHQILLISTIANVTIDLSEIGSNKSVGATSVGKVISEKNHLYLINQSITGIYEEVIDLLTV